MDFDKDFQNEVDMIVKNAEADFEKNLNQVTFNKEELTGIIRMVVKEELQIATKDIKEYLKKTLDERAQSNVSNEDIKEYSTGSSTTSTGAPPFRRAISASYSAFCAT